MENVRCDRYGLTKLKKELFKTSVHEGEQKHITFIEFDLC